VNSELSVTAGVDRQHRPRGADVYVLIGDRYCPVRSASAVPLDEIAELPVPNCSGETRQTMEVSMRLPNTAQTSRPWRIHELTQDFRLEDVWALPTPGGADDFSRLVHLIASSDPSRGAPRSVRMLWAIRWRVGELLGWDRPNAGSWAPTLRDKLPADLRAARSGPDFAALPFTSLYLLDDEWAAEIANRTMRGLMHVGWVPDGTGGYHGQMAVYVKPNGLLGTGYMAAIRPFRHLIVYPRMLRQIGRVWRAGAG